MTEAAHTYGAYQVLERLSLDKEAESFRALREGAKKPSLLKILTPSISSDPSFDLIYQDSVELGQNLELTGLMKVRDSGTSKGCRYIALEWVEGRSLRQLIDTLSEQGVTLPVELSAWVVLQLCESLAHLHVLTGRRGEDLGIVHHDLAPSTIRVGFDGLPRLCDARMVRAEYVEDPERSAARVGHPAYFAPERVKGARPSVQTDLWALGVILWELLTGRLLFQGDTREEVMAEVLITPIASPQVHNAGADSALVDIVLRALTRPPERRFQSASSLAGALRTWLDRKDPGRLRSGVVGIMDSLYPGEAARVQALTARLTPRLLTQAEPEQTRESGSEWVPWTLAAVAMLALGLVVVLILDRQAGEAPTLTLAQELIDDLHRDYPGASDPSGLTESGWQQLTVGSTTSDEAARQALEEAVAADPNNTAAVAGLALAYARLGRERGELSVLSVQLLARAEALEPSSSDLLRSEAGVALAALNYPGATQQARACLVKLPKDPFCTGVQGQALLGQGRPREAFPLLQAASSALPLADGLLRATGQAALESGDLLTAYRALSEAAERQPKDPLAHLAMAELHLRSGMWEALLQDTERVLALDRRNAKARLYRGELLLEVMADPAQAVQLLGALAEDPECPPELLLRAQTGAAFAALGAGRAQEAEGHARAALLTQPRAPMASLALAYALDSQSDLRGAEQVLAQAEPERLEQRQRALFNLHAGLFYLERERVVLAGPRLEEALRLAPHWLPPALALARVHARQQDPTSALEVLRTAAWIDPRVEADRRPMRQLQLPQIQETWQDISARLPEGPARDQIHALLQAWSCLQGEDCAGYALLPRSGMAPDQEIWRLMQARVLLTTGERDQALELLVGAHATLWGLRADTLLELGREADALYALDQASAQGPQGAALQSRRSQALLQSDPAGSRSAARQAMADDALSLRAAELLLKSER